MNANPQSRPYPLDLLLYGACTLLCVCAVASQWWRVQPGMTNYAAGLAWQMLAGAATLVWGWRLSTGRAAPWGRREWGLVIAVALLARLFMLKTMPVQSDDIYRYIWEGRMHWQGVNPFALAPDASSLAVYRDAIWAQVNHPSYTAIYPPFAQGIFAITAWLGYALASPVLIMKLVIVLFELGVGWLLGRWLLRRGSHPGWVLLWLWHPLVIAEFAGNGHLDALMILPLVAMLALVDRWAGESDVPVGAQWAALASLTLAILAKWIPALLVPFLLWWLPRRRWWTLALIPGAVALAFLPYASAGWEGLLRSMTSYSEHWSANGAAFEALRLLCDGDGRQARWVLLALFAVWGGGLWLRRLNPLEAAPWVLGFYLVIHPVVHPWYLTLILPFVVIRRAAWAPWLWLTATAPLDYLYYEGHSRLLTGAIIWIPFWGMLAWQGLKRLRDHRQRKAAAAA